MQSHSQKGCHQDNSNEMQKNVWKNNFKCNFCLKTFCDFFELKLHTKNVHYDNNSYTCRICLILQRKGGVFTSKPNLKTHLKIVHELKNPLSCTLCKKSFSYVSEFKHHKKVVHDGKTWIDVHEENLYEDVDANENNQIELKISSNRKDVLNKISPSGNGNHQKFNDAIEMDQSNDQIGLSKEFFYSKNSSNGKKEIVLNKVQNTWNENQQKFDDAIEMDQSNDQIVFDFPEFELQTDTNDLVPKEVVIVKDSISQIDLTGKIVRTQQQVTKTVDLTEKVPSEKEKQCPNCSRTFTKHKFFMQHFNHCSKFVHCLKSKQISVEQLLTFKCKICTKPFKTKAVLKKHVKGVHEKMQPISCRPCKVSVSYLSEFRYHRDVVHEGKKLTEIDDFDYYVYCGIEGNELMN